MQPIPITPAPVDSSAGVAFTVVMFILAGVFAAAFLVTFLLTRSESEERSSGTVFGLYVGLTLTAICAVGGLMGLTTLPLAEKSGNIQAFLDAADSQTADVQSEIKEQYGLKLNAKEANALEYPEKAPKEDFKIYGQLQQVGKSSQLQLPSDSIYLIWKDGSLQLAEGSGKSFTEIEPKG